MNARTLSDFLHVLVAIRNSSVLLSPAARDAYYLDGGRVIGFLAALRVAEVISSDEESRMYGLFCNATEHAGEPFPNRLNAGPCIWLWDLRKRNEQAQKVVHVGPVEVPVQAASEGLHVRRVLGASRVRKAFPASRAALSRLSPCWSPVLPRWALDGDSRALLLAARTQRQATEVLACDLRLGAPDSARADTRTTY